MGRALPGAAEALQAVQGCQEALCSHCILTQVHAWHALCASTCLFSTCPTSACLSSHAHVELDA